MKMNRMKRVLLVFAICGLAVQVQAQLVLNLLTSPGTASLATNTVVWTFVADGSAVVVTNGTVYDTLAEGLSGSLTDSGATGYFTVTAEATYKFDPLSFTNLLSPGVAGKSWAYNGASDTYGILSPDDTGIQIASTEGMVMTFDLSNLTIPEGKFFYVDGFKVQNGTELTPGGQRISYLENGTTNGVQLTGDSGEPNAVVGGEGAFQPLYQIVNTGDKIAIWDQTGSGQKRFMGFKFSVSAPATGTDVPANVAATGADTAVLLDWDDDESGFPLDYYSIYRGLVSGTNNYSLLTNVTKSTYVDIGLTNSTTYYYAVTSTGTNGIQSGYSDEVSATPMEGSTNVVLVQYLDATNAASVSFSTNNEVSVWADLSGNGNDAVAVAGSIPVLWPSTSLSGSGLAGMDVRTNRAVLDAFSSAASEAILDFEGAAITNSGFSVLVAFKADYVTQDNTRNVVMGNQENIAGAGFGLRYDRGDMAAFMSGTIVEKDSVSEFEVNDGDTVVYAFTYKAATGAMAFWDSKNKTVKTGVTAAYGDFSNANTIRLGGSSNTGQYMDGMIGEVQIYSSTLSEADLVSKGEALAAKWGASEPDGYSSWSVLWGVNLGANTNDYDSDGVVNLAEYALSGNPTNGLDDTISEFKVIDGGLIYIHAQPADDTGLVYSIETRTNLLSGSWSSESFVEVSTNETGGEYNIITNRIDTTAAQKFIRWLIDLSN